VHAHTSHLTLCSIIRQFQNLSGVYGCIFGQRDEWYASYKKMFQFVTSSPLNLKQITRLRLCRHKVEILTELLAVCVHVAEHNG